MKPVHPNLKRRLATAIMTASATCSAAAIALPTDVYSGHDAGPGTLREALENGASDIIVTAEGPILINQTLVYASDEPLTIRGNGQTVSAAMDFTLLEVSSGANLTVEGLNFEGPGNFSIENQSSADQPGKGIFVDVADNQNGWVSVVLTDVQVRGVANHGIHISDCDLADDCGGGGDGAGGGSGASIQLRLNNVQVDNVGQGKFDADGVRVDERGNGHIIFHATDSSFTRVGADGVELDEAQNGSVAAFASNSIFSDNGSYCDPALLGEFEDDGEFAEGELMEAPAAPTGTLDDACFEYEVSYYDDGSVEEYEIAIDLDDGFDIDESDDGSLKAVIRGSQIRRNLDEGIDFDEAGNGGINVAFIDSEASENTDDGFKVSESDNAGIEALVSRVTSVNNGGKGIVLEEEGNGSLNALVTATTTDNNDDRDNTGLEVVQDDLGAGVVTLRDSDIADGIDAGGVDVNED